MTRTQAVLLAVAALALVLLAGCATDPPLPAEQPARVPSLAERQQAPPSASLAGYEVSIPRIGARSDLTPLGLNPDKTVQVPPLSDVGQVGLYSRGPRPGQVGPAVLLGHINSGRTPGVFARLSELRDGDRVDVATPDGPRAFVVYRAETVPKDAFPSADVYSDTDGPELRLVSCGGTYDAANRNYLGQVLVWARLAS